MLLLDKYKFFIEVAINEAEKSSHTFRLGAVIFDKKTLISKGYNSGCKSAKKLHPRFHKYNSIHAEVAAILAARSDLKKCTLLVIRINKNKKNFLLARPCVNCLKYIKYVGIKKIIYSINEYPFLKEEKIR